MGLLLFLFAIFVGGLIVGGLARLALPGPDPMSIPATAALGIGGSLLGGVASEIFLGYGGGVIFALLGAVGLLAIHRHLVQPRSLS